ncbi:MAG: ornithine carbamoyltransferase [Candidatus Tectomicrobia bacterium]|nr:ornithine carbamoyltransferase [Candidatus Tectomicrobia bacterium]
MKRDFLTLDDVTRPEIEGLLASAARLKDYLKRGVPHRFLEGRTLGMIFKKPSSRTRVSFEIGMFQLGGLALFLSNQDLGMGVRESVADIGRLFSRYLDGIMVRTFAHEEVEELARYATIPVINGLTDVHHPCQILADLLTIQEKFGRCEGVKLTWVGDGNNVANSWLQGASKMGMHLSLACPKGYWPPAELICKTQEEAAANGGSVELHEDPFQAVKGADVIYTDVWVSMGQEAERRWRLEVFQPYQVNQALLDAAKPTTLVMHCLPAHRGEEITAEVIDGPQSIVFDHAENRLHTQKAVLHFLLGRREESQE